MGKKALVHLGPSIVGGAITTLAGTAFLLPCRILLFVKLGAMLFANALLSVTYTFFFLAPVLMIAGPVDDQFQVLEIVAQPVRAITRTLTTLTTEEGENPLKVL